jgi:hypothetical protein
MSLGAKTLRMVDEAQRYVQLVRDSQPRQLDGNRHRGRNSPEWIAIHLRDDG